MQFYKILDYSAKKFSNNLRFDTKDVPHSIYVVYYEITHAIYWLSYILLASGRDDEISASMLFEMLEKLR